MSAAGARSATKKTSKIVLSAAALTAAVGLATAAVTDVIDVGFRKLGLHRLEAATLLHNTASQRVLTRNGFRPFAVSEAYLKIAGRWQDHILFVLLSPGDAPRTRNVRAGRA